MRFVIEGAHRRRESVFPLLSGLLLTAAIAAGCGPHSDYAPSLSNDASPGGGVATGVGGVFFRAEDPEALAAWYRRHLGIQTERHGNVFSAWNGDAGSPVWAIFPSGSTYFDPSPKPLMINFRVDDLDRLLAELDAGGVRTAERTETHPNGRFTWLTDPEGNRIELWEPAEEDP